MYNYSCYNTFCYIIYNVNLQMCVNSHNKMYCCIIVIVMIDTQIITMVLLSDEGSHDSVTWVCVHL